MDDHTINFIKSTLWKHLDPQTTQAFIFGSRATKTNKKFSDIDIGIKSTQPISREAQIKIQDELEESDLPYIVELVNFNQVDKKFKKTALKHTIPLN